jgi:hypothetical protein
MKHIKLDKSVIENIFVFCIYVFALKANGWRYEKLPIASDFLSSYTKVEAGYNH